MVITTPERYKLLCQKRWYTNFQVWSNEQGTVNLLSIPMLAAAGYKVSTHTDHTWEVTTSKGEVIVFKRDTGICKSTTHINLREHAEGHVMIEPAQKNLEDFIRKHKERD